MYMYIYIYIYISIHTHRYTHCIYTCKATYILSILKPDSERSRMAQSRFQKGPEW